MQRHGRDEVHHRDGNYEQEEYDEYEEEAEEAEEDNEEEDSQPTREELEFLKLREKLKEQFRKDLKKQSASTFGHIGQSQDKRRTTNDKFGSFFGPSKPVIAQRVLEESRSIRETKHITSRDPSSSTGNKRPPASSSLEMKRDGHYRQPKAVNEVKKKAQTLKDMRDYSFLLSDDVDFPAPVKEKQPAPRNVPVSATLEDTQSAHGPLKNKIQSGKPVLASNGRTLKSSIATNQHAQGKVGPAKGAPVSRPKLAAAESGKVSNANIGNGPGRPVVHKALPYRGPQATSRDKPPTKVITDQSLRQKPLSLKPHSSTQNRYTEQKRVPQESEKLKQMVKQPLPTSRAQLMKPPSKPTPARGVPENRLKKRPVNRHLDEEDDPENIQMMIRSMFRYNPNKYVDNDDDSDMEVGFDVIQKEERRSSKIAKKEDEEELLRILEEEEREERARMRKKQRQH